MSSDSAAKDELIELLRKQVEELEAENEKPDPPSNDVIVDQFFAAQGYASATEKPYRYAMKFLREHTGDKPLTEITTSDALDFANNWGRNGESVRSSTMENYLGAAKRLIDWTTEQDWGPDENPIEKAIERFKSRNSAELRRSGQNVGTVLSPQEYIAFLRLNRTPRTYALLMLAVKTGLRRKELAWLKVEDVDLAAKEVYNTSPKGVGDKRLPKVSADIKLIDDETVQALERWLKNRERIMDRFDEPDEGWLFPNQYGGQPTPMAVTRWFDKATDRASKALRSENPELADDLEDFTPHDTRRCFTTWLNQRGCPRDTIAALRGDSNEDMVAHYTKINKEEIREQYESAMPSVGI